jgi:hypothetical protein
VARSATARDLLSSLVRPSADQDDAPALPPLNSSAARWCHNCGAPRNLGRRDCPGCRLLAEHRERIVTHLARHGMPAGGAVELALLADVPLRAVGRMMAAAREPQGISPTAR